jgi:hypothetical protein
MKNTKGNTGEGSSHPFSNSVSWVQDIAHRVKMIILGKQFTPILNDILGNYQAWNTNVVNSIWMYQPGSSLAPTYSIQVNVHINFSFELLQFRNF